MLTIIKGSTQADDYFSKDNYYTKQEGIEHSEWNGRGAELLGLSGCIDPDRFKQLLEGEVDGQTLGRVVKGERQHRSGWDLTFSAPKSLSILSEVFGMGDLREAHDRAVKHALRVAEKLIQTRLTKDGVTQVMNTQNAVFASFTHDVNRNLDCQLHTHNYLLNMTHTDSGWRSLYTELLFKSQREKELGKVYRMALAKELVSRDYGLKQHPKDPSLFEIEGVPESLIDEFSTRSKEIEDWFKSKKIPYDPVLAKTVALITRSAKKSISREALRSLWQERSNKHAFDVDEFKRNRSPNEQAPERSQAKPGALSKKALKNALEHLSEKEMGFTEEELYKAAIKFSIGDLFYEDIDQEIQRLKDTCGVIRSKNHPDLQKRQEQYWTTPKLKALELTLIKSVVNGKNAFDLRCCMNPKARYT